MKTPKRPAALLLALCSLHACAVRPSDLAQDQRFVVAVKTSRLPDSQPWISRFAEHSWIDVKDGDGWRRVEVITRSSGVVTRRISVEAACADSRWSGKPVHVLATWYGERARDLGAEILAVAGEYPHTRDYHAWPGPNSNTFVDWLQRRVPGLHAELYPNAVGRDYAPIVRAGVTATGAGVELETPYLGVQVGLVEGAELHLLGLTVGVGLWPPQLKLPFLPPVPFGFFTR